MSAARALRVALLEAQHGRLERPTRRALLAAGADIALVLRPSDPRSFGERAQALRDARPDLVLVPLADRGGADELAGLSEPLRLGCAAQLPPPRALVVSSDDGAIARAATLLAPLPTDVLPDVRAERGLRLVVERMREMRGDEQLAPERALELLAARFAEARGGPALVAGVGGDRTSLVRAAPGEAALAVHARPLGVGRAADRVVARAGLERVRRWIPWAVDQPTLLERVFNRARWPDAASSGRETLALEIALAHEALALALADAAMAGLGTEMRSARHILLTGRLAALPGPERSVLVAVDALDPVEPATIARDDGGRLAELAASAIAGGEASVLDEALLALAAPLAAVLPVVTARRTVVRIGGREERVARNAFFTVALPGPSEVSAPGMPPATVASGPLGLVVDARPRPLTLPLRDAERVPAVTRWYETLGALPA